MHIKFEQRFGFGNLGRQPEVNNPLQQQLLSAFLHANEYATDKGFYKTMDLSPEESLQPLYVDTRPDNNIVCLGTSFWGRTSDKSNDSASLMIQAMLDAGSTTSAITIMQLVYPSERDTAMSMACHYLNQEGKPIGTYIKVKHSKYITNHRISQGFSADYSTDQPTKTSGEKPIELLTRSYVYNNTQNEYPTPETLPIDMSQLILSGQIIPLLEMIATGKTS